MGDKVDMSLDDIIAKDRLALTNSYFLNQELFAPFPLSMFFFCRERIVLIYCFHYFNMY